MAPRILLQELNPNRVPNGELSIKQRNRILGIRNTKTPIHEIIKKYKVSRGAVENTIRQELLRQKATTFPRFRRPSIVTPIFERRLLRLVRKFPKSTYVTIQSAFGTTLSKTTLYRVLKKNSLTNWLAKKRLFFTLITVKIYY